MKTRINLDYNCIKKINLNHHRLQKLMYTKLIWGCYNTYGIKISKLILNLQPLFPVNYQEMSLEFINVRKYDSIKPIDDFENSDRFDINLNLVCYFKNKWFIQLHQRVEIQTALIDLPRLLKDDTIIIENIKKILVSQLTVPPGFHVEISEDQTDIELLFSWMLNIKLNNLDIKISNDRCSANLLDTLLSLKTKWHHILNGLTKIRKFVYYKKLWRILVYKRGRETSSKFGFRRSLRCLKDFLAIQQGKEVVLIFGKNLNSNFIVNDVGRLIKLNLSTAMFWYTDFNGIIESEMVEYVKKLANTSQVDYNGITENDIKDVNLTLPGRVLLDNLLCSNDGWGLDLLTKKDLIKIWCYLFDSRKNLNLASLSVKVLKGVGDVVIDIIKKNMSRALDSILFQLIQGNFTHNDLIIAYNKTQDEVKKLFCSSSLCQYFDQVNSLSTLSQQCRITCIKEGFKTTKITEFTARDVERWHLTKICPIESPEGQNIGLVLSLVSYAGVDINGYITTAYFKVYNKTITNNVVHLNFFDEKEYVIAMPSKWNLDKYVVCMDSNRVKVFETEHAMLVIPTWSQVFSPAVCLIPFLGHNDPTRALMAANMQKQAIPLLFSQPPLVGTGEESMVMEASNQNVATRSEGIVYSVDSKKIIIYNPSTYCYRGYNLLRSMKTNQEMCFRLRAVVSPGQVLKAGGIIAECQSSCDGEMSLGINLMAAFMCWKGLNYEDSILLSDSIISKGLFNSLHILDVEVKVLETDCGEEWLTNKPMGVLEKNCQHLNTNGIAREGWILTEGDILVGKSTPIDNNVSDNEHNIDDKVINNEIDFENKNKFIKDTSFRIPMGINHAIVLEVSRNVDKNDEWYLEGVYEEYLYRKFVITKTYVRRCYILLNRLILSLVKDLEQSSSSVSSEQNIQNGLMILKRNYICALEKLDLALVNRFNKCLVSDTTEIDSKIVEIITIRLLVKRSIKVGDKICGRHGNKGVISRIVPRKDMPFMADGTSIDVILNPLGVPSRMNIGQLLEANFGLISYKLGLEFKRILDLYYLSKNENCLWLIVPKLRELYPNIKNYTKDVILLLVSELSRGVKISCSNFDFDVDKNIKHWTGRLGLQDWDGQVQLYDGETGLPFERKTTVGIIYMLKLNHLVDNKMWSRSTGPYSVITQQPLKGKTNKGGQRLGEMEVWALQSYGAAFVTHEALTAKCDDIKARKNLHDNLLAGFPILINYQNEGILVLLKELFAIGVDIEQIEQWC
ncbi:DNA-directed RNA polymerase subunit beta [Candidatus Hodgkinia cicadicola]|uniref:DNA-directed RNA polymerase subunit beta n=1 Tax=Candidatus Hodgkinia cicadicola TaxID=573658 RepID=A0ABX4MES3_9HYPH|nr:DNA-directed RNA polymerase subunit beta [Candidatus Hodgkinia cicadicola]